MKITIQKTLALSLGLCLLFILSCTPKVGKEISKASKNNPEPKVIESDTAKLPMVVEQEFNRSDALPIDPHVRTGTLSNGMKYYIRKNGKPEKRAEFRLAVNVGAMQEDDDQKGLAHFIEHMAFNGTANFKKNDLVNYLESIGMKFGPDLNAYTSFDETVYMLQIPTDDPKIVDKGLLIMQDWASNISFDEEEIDKERGVVLSEWRTGLGAQERMRNEWFPLVFFDSRYAERLPIGDPAIIKNASYATIKRYYEKWYRPDLMAVSVVGDFNINEMEAMIKKRFGAIEKPAIEIQREIYEVPDHDEVLVAIASDKEATSTGLQIIYKHNHQSVKTVDDFRNQLMYQMYNGMLNARLDELTRNAEPPYIYAYSGYSGLVRSKDAYFSYVLVPNNGIEAGLKAVLKENKRVKVHGFTMSEFERQLSSITNSVDNSYKEKDKTPSNRYVMEYVYNFLENTPMTGIEYEKMLTEQLLPTIKLEEINKLADKWLTDKNQAIVITMPENKDVSIPTKNQILKWMNEANAIDVEPYTELEGISSLMDRPLTGSKFYQTKEHKDVGVTEIQFLNGVKVILKPTDFQNDEILMTAFRKGGNSLYNDDDYMTALMADNVVTESGISEYKASQLEKYLSDKTVGVYPYIGELYEGFSGYSSQKDLEIMFQLLYLYFQQPNFDLDAALSLVTKLKAQVKNQAASPRYHFYDDMYKVLYKNNYRRVIKNEADYDKINVKKAYRIFRERFNNINDYTFVFVGNFDEKKITPLVEHYLFSLPRNRKADTTAHFIDLGIEKATGNIEKTVKRGQEPQSIVSMQFYGDFEVNNQNIYDFNSMAQVLRIMLREAMREDKGGVYGVNVSPSISREPKQGYNLTISFLCAPDDVNDLVNTALEQIKELQKNGPSTENIKKVQETQRRDREKQLQENRFWRSQLESIYKYNKSISDILDFTEDYIDLLRADDVRTTASKYLNTESYFKMVLMPEK